MFVTKRNRKKPNRNRAPARANPATPASLPPGIRVRHATAADLPTVRELTASAGCPLDDELATAVNAGDAGSALRVTDRSAKTLSMSTTPWSCHLWNPVTKL